MKTLNLNEMKNFRRRIMRASNTLSVCGDLMLEMDIDFMSIETCKQLNDFLLSQKNVVQYAALTKKINSEIVRLSLTM